MNGFRLSVRGLRLKVSALALWPLYQDEEETTQRRGAEGAEEFDAALKGVAAWVAGTTWDTDVNGRN